MGGGGGGGLEVEEVPSRLLVVGVGLFGQIEGVECVEHGSMCTIICSSSGSSL